MLSEKQIERAKEIKSQITELRSRNRDLYCDRFFDKRLGQTEKLKELDANNDRIFKLEMDYFEIYPIANKVGTYHGRSGASW